MIISDTHNDFLTKFKEKDSLKYLHNCESKNVKNLLCSVFTSELNNYLVLQKIRHSHSLLLSYGNLGYKIHVEDLGFLDSNAEVESLIHIKPFSCSLTWNNDNKFAGGNFGIGNITKQGQSLIKRLQGNKIIVDVAHLNKKSFHSFTKINNKPIFCSHTSLDFIKKSPRNLTNSQVKEIISTGGYIGLFLSSTFTTNGERLSSKAFAEMVYKIMCRFGDNNFGLGSDFYGIFPNPTDISNYEDLSKVAKELEHFGVQKQSICKFFYKNFADFAAKCK